MKKDDDGDAGAPPRWRAPSQLRDRDPLSFAAALARYEAHARLRNFSRRTWTSCYRLVLEDLFAFLFAEGVSRVSEVTREALQRFQHAMLTERSASTGRPLKASTVATRTAVVRSFFSWAEREGLTVTNPASLIQAPRVRRPLPRGLLTKREAERLLEAPDEATDKGRRDRAMLEVLYGTGIRLTELTTLTVEAFDTEERTLRVHGKGDKTRLVPLGRRAFRVLLSYVEEVRGRLPGADQTSLLFFAKKGGKRLNGCSALGMVKRYALRAGIEKTVTVHGLRHTFGTHLLRGGADIRAVQEILGHATLSTTERYTHLVTEDLRRAILKHHPRERLE